jgi:hypothetical protein
MGLKKKTKHFFRTALRDIPASWLNLRFWSKGSILVVFQNCNFLDMCTRQPPIRLSELSYHPPSVSSFHGYPIKIGKK